MTEPMPWVTGKTRLFGVIAHPADHVRAPMVFNPLFADRGLDHVMVPVDAPPADLAAVIDGLRAMPNFCGLAVTIPHKMALAEMCDTLGPAAKLTGAVNAVRFDADGSLHGDNFDGVGFVAGLRQYEHEPAGKSVLMIGAGGAARAIALALCDAGVAELQILNRTQEKAQQIVEDLSALAGHEQASAVSSHDGAAMDFIINTTSLGLHDGDALPLSLDTVSSQALIADIIMVPAKTAWLADAERRGLATHYGRHMLDCQAELIGSFIGAL